MAQIRDYRKLAHDIICEVGGKRKYCQCHKMCNEIETGIKGRAGTGKKRKLQQWRE